VIMSNSGFSKLAYYLLVALTFYVTIKAQGL
jgi:hypothetical protein